MDTIPFTKMHGCGNDFIVIDNRANIMDKISFTEFVVKSCKRRFGVGADGLILLENSSIADFKMRYFNADGSEGEMCGNGARCICIFASQLGVVEKQMTFETMNGVYEASIKDSRVKIKFPSIKRSEVALNRGFSFNNQMETFHYAYVGVPHTVWLNESFKRMGCPSFHEWGSMIRNRSDLFPEGTNVNVIEVLDRHHIKMRTFERGVEEETLACGSGATASAIVAQLLSLIEPPVIIHTHGGPLEVSFQLTDEMIIEIFLEGNAITVYEGTLFQEAGKVG